MLFFHSFYSNLRIILFTFTNQATLFQSNLQYLPYSSQKYICKILDLPDHSHNNLPNRYPSRSMDIVFASGQKPQDIKQDRMQREFGSHSSRSDAYVSASKSNKAFEDSLRKPDSLSLKREKSNSPLTKKLIFGKSGQEKAIDPKPSYIVDITKKIKKVDSPFLQYVAATELQDPNKFSETNILVSSFDSISQKIESQPESSNQFEKNAIETHEIQLKNFADEVEQVLQTFECAESNTSLKQEFTYEIILEESQEKSSNDFSVKSKSSEEIRIRRKNKKIRKRNQKKEMVKQIKEKLRTITEFVDQLHRKESHTKREHLVEQLSKHLHEEKLVRLRNELKKLI